MCNTINRSLLDFLDSCTSQYHATKNVADILTKNGFTQINEGELSTSMIKPGGKYFVIKNMSSLIAFCTPTAAPSGYLIAASHSDSPTFKIKDNGEKLVQGKYVQLNVERYGGMLCAPWFDRPLSVAGKILCTEGDSIVTKLVSVDRDLLIIPNLAVHMNRKANDGFEFKANVDMLPLFGGEGAKDTFLEIIAKSAGVEKESIIGTDLYLYNRQHGVIFGADDEFIAAPRLDDLQCAFSSLEAFITADAASSHVQMYMLSDNEEVGSDTKQGAGSTFLNDIIGIINASYGMTGSDMPKLMANSFMLSCDNAHAVHPNHPEFSDSSNKPYLNGGVVIKYGVRYATDSVAEAIFRRICTLADVPYQTYSNRSDMAGGSTLGNISNTKVALNTVDIGLAQLAMHSSYETAGAKDTVHMVKAIKYFYETDIRESSCGNYTVVRPSK